MFPIITYSAPIPKEKQLENDRNNHERLNELHEEYRARTPVLLRQQSINSENEKDIFNDLFQYTRLNNQSSSSSEEKADTQLLKPVITTQPQTPTVEANQPTRSNKHSDQKLPKLKQQKSPAQSVKSFVYVNKNGYAKLIKADLSENDKNLNTSSIDNHSVPMNILNQSLASSTITSAPQSNSSSFLQTNENGQIQINTNIMVNDEYIDIKYDHVKYLSLVAILCCWCFPFTGIPAVIYTCLMKKFYNLHDMLRAKEYLLKSERFVLLTFFFGFTLISIIFAIIQVQFFNTNTPEVVNPADPKVPQFRPFIPH